MSESEVARLLQLADEYESTMAGHQGAMLPADERKLARARKKFESALRAALTPSPTTTARNDEYERARQSLTDALMAKVSDDSLRRSIARFMNAADKVAAPPAPHPDGLREAIAEVIARFEHETGPQTHSDDDGAVWPVPAWVELGTDVRRRLIRVASPLAEKILGSDAMRATVLREAGAEYRRAGAAQPPQEDK
jgi:hypothetical protein